jgi:hypothetical protein
VDPKFEEKHDHVEGSAPGWELEGKSRKPESGTRTFQRKGRGIIGFGRDALPRSSLLLSLFPAGRLYLCVARFTAARPVPFFEDRPLTRCSWKYGQLFPGLE